MALIEEALSHWSKRSMQLQHLHGLHARINVELYRGNGARAFEELERAWPDVERSMLLRHELTRTRAWELRGRAALAAIRNDANPAARRVVGRALRALRGVRTIGAPGLCALRGGDDGAAMQRAATDEIAMEGAAAPSRFLTIFVPWHLRA